MGWFLRAIGAVAIVTVLLAGMDGRAETVRRTPGARQSAPASPSPNQGAPADTARIIAVLVAGDGREVAFDNAADRFRMFLQSAAGVTDTYVRQFTSVRRGQGRAGLGVATAANVLQTVRSMRPQPGQVCEVFMTSHGVHGEGFWLGLQEEVITPRALDAALMAGCGGAPTAVVVSACYSGIFAAPPMTRPNRVILTAARADRSSFGCGAGKQLTDYDRCLLGVLEAGTWREVYAGLLPCIAANEQGEGFVPSEPQAFFGAQVTALRPDGGS